ncbi:MAG: SAM-dependent methyltransferase, partial [Acidobacteria bacterium]|nr:SAM-dependent methyltransferase [Acidobacteriota bacterium]
PVQWPPEGTEEIPEGAILEWREAFDEFYRFASAALRRGMMLHFDYGEERDKLNPQGTLRTFFRHRLGDDPLTHLGEQDITASVDFSHLVRLGQQYHFQSRLLGQRQYLIERGILQKVALRFEGTPPDPPGVIQEKLAVKDLVIPGGISDHFKVLIQERAGAAGLVEH